MKNVLICLSSFSRGNGIAKFIMNYYDSLIKNNYSVDFLLVHNGISDKKYLEKIKENNGQIFYIPLGNIKIRVKRTQSEMKKILDSKKYDIVHVNLVDLYAYGCISIAKKNNINKIVYHVHNPYTIGKLLFLRDILNYLCIKNSTDLVACTKHAGNSMFHNRQFNVIRNAVYFENYKYNENDRINLRKTLNLEEKFIVGAVGRLNEQKNPLFALKIFKEIKHKKRDAHFIWVGVGELKEKLLKYSKKNNLEDNITFLENREDINKLYSAFDIFLLPSKYEGLGIVFLEAECNGLPIYTSTKVPIEIKKCDLVHFISLKNTYKDWAKKILDSYYKNNDRNKYFDILKDSDYDFEKNKNALINLYESEEK